MIVTPIITDSITEVQGIVGNAVTVTAEITKDITADAEVVNSIVEVSADCSSNITAEATLTTAVSFGDYDYYSGAVEVTPSTATQTLHTAGKVVLDNITINPIPSNYGLITWDGAVLTVS